MTVAEIVDRAGGARALALAVGVHYASVYDWLRNGQVPIKRTPSVARAIHVTPQEVRPDFFCFSEMKTEEEEK